VPHDKARIWFFTDIHGSDRCFRKFLNLYKHENKPNVLIIGGDITGKQIAPLVHDGRGGFYTPIGTERAQLPLSELPAIKKELSDVGYYPYECDEQMHSQLRFDKQRFKTVFDQRTIKAPAAAALIAKRRQKEKAAPTVFGCPDHWIRGVLQTASESVGVIYGQQVPGGWCPHDLRHTCLTNLALAGVPLNGIKEYAGHSSIVETQRYLKFMPESIELAAMVTSRLAELTRATAESPQGANAIEDPDDDGLAPQTSRGR
jgi:hypothetical protein